MRFLLLTLLFLSSFSAAVLEVQNCPSLANSNFTLKVISSVAPEVTFDVPVAGLTTTLAMQNAQTYFYDINFTSVPKGLYVVVASAAGSSVRCSFGYASPEITSTKIPDSNVFIVVLSVLACTFVLFGKGKKR